MPGSCCKFVYIVREIAAVFSNNFLGRRMQLPRTAIVAKSFPQPQHVGFIRGRQRMDIGERANEAIEVVPTVATCVCCSMISLIHTRYGSRDWRQGRSRLCVAYQAEVGDGAFAAAMQ